MEKSQNLSWRILSVILVLLFVGVLLGCSGGKSFVGKYVSRNDSEEYLELEGDGTFYLEVWGRGFAGTYEVEGTTITLKFDIGLADRGTIDDNTLVGLDLFGEEPTT